MQLDLVDTLLHYLPDLGIETLNTAVQTVRTVVNGQMVFYGLSTDGWILKTEYSSLDAVRHTSADGVEIGLLRPPFVRGLKTEYDVFHFALAVGYEQFGDLRPEVTHLYFQSPRTLYCIKLNRFHGTKFIYVYR